MKDYLIIPKQLVKEKWSALSTILILVLVILLTLTAYLFELDSDSVFASVVVIAAFLIFCASVCPKRVDNIDNHPTP